MIDIIRINSQHPKNRIAQSRKVMYGGLFGDLPPTKEQQQQQQKSGETTHTAIPRKKEIGADEIVAKQKKEPSSVVRQLGTSGTAVAFIPAAARRRNLKRPAVSSSTSECSNTKDSRPSAHLVVDTQKENPQNPQQFVSTTFQVSTWVPCPPEIIKQQQQQKQDEETYRTMPVAPTTVPLGATHTKRNDDDDGEVATATHLSSTEHTHRSDRYDPFLPNDLLEYWERKAVEETWRAQEAEHMRRRMQETAEQIRHAQETEHMRQLSSDPPRGRGRGLSNLPAWMVEHQRRQEVLGSASTEP